ncbi:hypothetical protein ACHQM5_019029 [Ranunculus cassubicifolius]
MRDARKLFDEMPERDCVSWNSMMSGYFHNGECEETINVFMEMIRESRCDPDQFSLSCVLKACGSLELLDLGLQLHSLAKKYEFGRDSYVETSVIDMYIKCGEMSYADKLFKGISKPSVFCWNSMVFGYAKAYGIQVAFDTFNRMPERDNVSWNTNFSF